MNSIGWAKGRSGMVSVNAIPAQVHPITASRS